MTALDEIERIREDLEADDTYAEYGGRDIGILLAEIDRLRSLQGESPSTGTTSELVAQRPQGSASESPALLTSKDVDIPEIYAWVRAQFGGHFPSMDEIARAFYERCAAETPAPQPLAYNVGEEGWMSCDHCDSEVVEALKCTGCGATSISRPPLKSTAPVCPTCKTEFAFEGDVCGLCHPEARP